ncbi:MAG: Pycsar system effector family protein [Bacteroidota bacterium]
MNEKLEFYWYSLNKTLDHIKFSDGKAALLLSFYGILISLLFTQSEQVVEQYVNGPGLKRILLVLNVAFSLISIYFAFNTINPRLKNPGSTSIIYFGDIHKKYKTPKEFFEFGNQKFEDPDAIFRDLSDQLYVNSSIAYKKFFNVSWALRFFVVSIVTFLIVNLF